MLLFYHLFYSESYMINQNVKTVVLSIRQLSQVAAIGNICVTIFIFLSGYGIASVLEDDKLFSKRTLLFLLNRILKVLLSFWFIYILFVPWQPFFGNWPYKNAIEIIADFFGLSLFSKVYINESWWYMGILMICYVLSPLLLWLSKKVPALLCAITVLLSLFGNYYVILLCGFVIGILLKKYKILDTCCKIIASFSIRKTIYGFIVSLIFLICSLSLAYKNQMTCYYLLLCFTIIVTSVFLIRFEPLKVVLVFLGKHSSNIYYFHTFLYLYDFTDLVYKPRYAILIYICFVIVCVIISILVELLKRTIRYDKLIASISRKILKPTLLLEENNA